MTEPPGSQEPPTLTRLGFALLSLIAGESHVVHAYEVVSTIALRGGALGYSESQIYRELRKLADDGYLQQRTAAIKTNDRRVVAYNRTEAGMRAMRVWAATPGEVAPRADISEVVPRLRAAGVLPAKIVLEGLRPLKDLLEDEIEELRIVEREMKRDSTWTTLIGTEFDVQRDVFEAHLHGLERALFRLEQMASEQARFAADEARDDDSEEESVDVKNMENFVARTRPTWSHYANSEPSESLEVEPTSRPRKKRSPRNRG
jgi:DNA-binding PadR family transcriptional regulator